MRTVPLARFAPPRPLAIGAAVSLLLAGSIAFLGEEGAFSGPMASVAAPSTLAGVTVEDDAADAAMPVVTSLRSDGEAERRGLRVGDRIAAIDGSPVSSVAALDRAVRADADGSVALHVQRGDALWTLALDRAELEPEPAAPHDAQDPAG